MIFLSAADDRFARLTSKSRQRDNAFRNLPRHDDLPAARLLARDRHGRSGGSTALVGPALDAGVNFFDTANVYSEGQSENQLGQALRDLGVQREDIVVATKVRGRMGPGRTRSASRAATSWIRSTQA